MLSTVQKADLGSQAHRRSRIWDLDPHFPPPIVFPTNAKLAVAKCAPEVKICKGQGRGGFTIRFVDTVRYLIRVCFDLSCSLWGTVLTPGLSKEKHDYLQV